jgi:hypothetical protein
MCIQTGLVGSGIECPFEHGRELPRSLEGTSFLELSELSLRTCSTDLLVWKECKVRLSGLNTERDALSRADTESPWTGGQHIDELRASARSHSSKQ